MDYEALKAKYNAEEVGDRLIAEVNGQRQYIADKTVGGGFALTPTVRFWLARSPTR